MQPLFPPDAHVAKKRLRSTDEYEARTAAFRQLLTALQQPSTSSEKESMRAVASKFDDSAGGSGTAHVTAVERSRATTRNDQPWTAMQLVWGDTVSQWCAAVSRRTVSSQRCQQMQVLVELFTAETSKATATAGTQASKKPAMVKANPAQPHSLHGSATAADRVPPPPHVLGRLACHVALGKYDGPFGAVSFYDDLVDVYVLESSGLLWPTTPIHSQGIRPLHGGANAPAGGAAVPQPLPSTGTPSLQTPTWAEVHRLVRRYIGEMPTLYSQNGDEVPGNGDNVEAVTTPGTRYRGTAVPPLSRTQHARRCVASLCLLHIEGLVRRSLPARGAHIGAAAFGCDPLGGSTVESTCAVLDAAVQQAKQPMAGQQHTFSRGIHRLGLPSLLWSDLQRRVGSGNFYTSLAQFARDIDMYAISVLARTTPRSVVDVDAESELHKRAAVPARARDSPEGQVLAKLQFVFAGVREALRAGLVDRICSCFLAEYGFAEALVPDRAFGVARPFSTDGTGDRPSDLVSTFPGSAVSWADSTANTDRIVEGLGSSPAARALRVILDLRSMDSRGALYNPLWRLEIQGAGFAARRGHLEEDSNLWKLPLSSLYCMELAVLGALSADGSGQGSRGAEDERRKADHFSDDASCFDWLTTQLEELVDDCVQTLGPAHETTKLAGTLRHDLVRRAKAHGLLA